MYTSNLLQTTRNLQESGDIQGIESVEMLEIFSKKPCNVRKHDKNSLLLQFT